MNKQARTHAVAVAIMASIGVAAPLASWAVNAPKGAPVAPSEEGPVTVLPELVVTPEHVEHVVTLDPVSIVSHAKRAAKAPKAPKERCFDHALEQGGSPDHPTVRVCVPAG